ncbi:type II toxin-antitoxin system PemK/MazF family toxin [Dapis sp. BLCC M126]|uniref:type II toxin-antitoxin system PemK/MazF family toxin n=1 Tax=Dapis sp. BLCC M126 TaxID=3400189 RepID=UPI003CEB645A
MTIYKFGDVILVPFPFTNQTTSKKRPAVVVSSDIYNSQYTDLIIMAITSQNKVISRVGEVIVTEWSNAGLVKPSIIKPVIATIEKVLVIRKLGKLEDGDCQALKNAISEILDE